MLLTTAAFAAAVAFWIVFTLPPSAVQLTGSPPPATRITGAYHIHSNRSDGTGTPEEIARAAAQAGLQFVIITDHGDGTRTPDPPTYRDGVLCIDAVEINTTGGHVVALGLRGPSPYPLAGEARDVIDDVHRLGGLAVAAHPDSPKPELRWRAQRAAFDGIEWINADSEWRDDPPRQIIATAVRSLIRPPEAIASLFGRPVRTLERWDAAARMRPVFGLAALDAHARISWREDEEPRQRTLFARPSYAAMFSTLAQTVILDAPLNRDAASDAARVISAIGAGRSFSIVRAFAGPADLEFSATTADGVISPGGRIASAPSMTFHAQVPQAPGARLVLTRTGSEIASSTGTLQWSGAGEPGAYRVEAQWPGTSTPWLMSNPIVVVGNAPAPPIGPPPDVSGDPASLVVTPVPLDDQTWTVEKDPTSEATTALESAARRLEFRLAPGLPHSQYAALAGSVSDRSGVEFIEFTARAAAPMRIDMQVRLFGGKDGQRWRGSAYVDATARRIKLWLRDLEPAGFVTSQRPNFAPIQALLFVVDTLNTKPGTAGTLWISDVSLGVRR